MTAARRRARAGDERGPATSASRRRDNCRPIGPSRLPVNLEPGPAVTAAPAAAVMERIGIDPEAVLKSGHLSDIDEPDPILRVTATAAT
jgi:hypothetical protein